MSTKPILLWALALFFLPQTLLADAPQIDRVELHLGAAHFDTKTNGFTDRFNDNTPGVGIGAGSWSGGIYRNSFKKTALYVAYNLPLGDWVGIEAGVATGYDELYGNALQPVGLVYIDTGVLRWRIIPGEVVAFGLSLNIKIN